MKPHLLKIPLHPDHSFSVRLDVVPNFYDQWHYHPEAELVLIIKGSGRLFVGDAIHYFKPGDLLFLGAGLPHLWRSDEPFLEPESMLRVEAIVLHFMPDCMGAGFFSLPENRELARLLELSKQAIKIDAPAKIAAGVMMHRLLKANGTERILLLLELLFKIATAKQKETICSKDLINTVKPGEADRLNTIYQYILDNFHNEITLEDMAAIANLTPHSFCRYFKSRIKKTFSRFLLEVRVGNASRLLTETEMPVADVCYESGFNNFSNFNRHFKAVTGVSPLLYRKQRTVEQEV